MTHPHKPRKGSAYRLMSVDVSPCSFLTSSHNQFDDSQTNTSVYLRIEPTSSQNYTSFA